ncbi:MAG: hypothetical protein H7235_10955, partial [Bdellovibrionaceae bacterium]|nr:hypothetical protein [Pseudobdellovibrionaceae bacterium]
FNDKDDTIRLTFNLTSETSIEISASKSHGIVMQNWTTDYILELSSTIFDSWGYSFGVTQSKSTDSIQETYSGDASLSHYF